MKKSRFSESKIISILKEADSGRSVKEVCPAYIKCKFTERTLHYFEILSKTVLNSPK